MNVKISDDDIDSCNENYDESYGNFDDNDDKK